MIRVLFITHLQFHGYSLSSILS
uniref:Uncharacterized protein n=1 Tax=Lepeophtheirus salmonis TaxID=72036 RepID=A0A0K2THP4_LEPSM